MGWRWWLEVDESFAITNRGTVVVGRLHGIVTAGEPAVVVIGQVKDTVDGVWPELHGPSDGRAALLLRGIDKSRVPLGTVVHSAD